MSDTWTLVGQSGKAVNATERTLEELRAGGLRVRFEAMNISAITWTVWLKDVGEISTYVPDLRQTMTLRVNGDRFFTGWVVGRDPLLSEGRMGYDITVADAWFFLANTMLSSEVLDGTGTAKERPVYLLPAGDLTTHLQSVISRAVALGLPVQAGALADSFDLPRLSMQNQSIGASLSDLMACLADGTLWLDHSGSGDVAVRMSRRSTADEISIAAGTAIITEVSLRPRVDLEVEEVKLSTAKRTTSAGKRVTVFEETTAGSSTSVLPTRGLAAITGPEVNLTLPQDLTDSVEIEVAAFTPTAALQHGHDLLKQNGPVGMPEVYTTQTSNGAFGSTLVWPADPLLQIVDTDGNEISPEDWPQFLTKGEPRDWWKKDLIEYVQVRITATVASYEDTAVGDDVPEPPKWARLVGARARTIIFFEGEIGGSTAQRTVWEATISATVVCCRGLSNGTLIRSEDWGWFNPPADLAANLLASQNFVPWEGKVSTVQEEMEHGNPVGSVLNITNWVPEAATMAGIITGCTIIPRTGEVTYTVGPPLRHSFLDLVNRFRQSGADNYYWLADPTDDGSSAGGGITEPPAGPAGQTLDEAGNPELTEDGQYTLDES